MMPQYAGGNGEIAHYIDGQLTSDPLLKWESGVLYVPHISGNGEEFLTITAASTQYGLVLEGDPGKSWQLDNNGDLWPAVPGLKLGNADQPVQRIVTDLPTSDQMDGKTLWRDGTSVKVSTGP